jgi:hypothetical protein
VRIQRTGHHATAYFDRGRLARQRQPVLWRRPLHELFAGTLLCLGRRGRPACCSLASSPIRFCHPSARTCDSNAHRTSDPSSGSAETCSGRSSRLRRVALLDDPTSGARQCSRGRCRSTDAAGPTCCQLVPDCAGRRLWCIAACHVRQRHSGSPPFALVDTNSSGGGRALDDPAPKPAEAQETFHGAPCRDEAFRRPSK